MDEVLSKLFHERMDVNGASDVMRAIQSGLIGLEVTAMGPLGIEAGPRRICFFQTLTINKLELD